MSRPYVRVPLKWDGLKRGQTFSAFDIIRITCLNLTRNEIVTVFLFFAFAFPVILALEFPLFVALFGLRIPKTLFSLYFKFFRRVAAFELFKLFNLIGLRLESHDIDVFRACVMRLHKLFPR